MFQPYLVNFSNASRPNILAISRVPHPSERLFKFFDFSESVKSFFGPLWSEWRHQMAPWTAASVCWCAMFCLVLLVNSVFCLRTESAFSREMLMNIRVTTPENLFPTFIASSVVILDILVKGALTFVPTVKRRMRGKHAGSLAVGRGLRTPLPGIFLSNVRSLRNKLDELQLLLGKKRDFSSSSVLCFTEKWLFGSKPDFALQLAGFQLFRVDRNTELCGKTKGGGICFYTNCGWCNDVTVIQQHSSPDLEYFFIKCKPFYSPRVFVSFILVGVYIPPHGSCARGTTHARRPDTDLDSLVIVLGDFNKGILTRELPKYRQFIKCPTREQNILDYCYTTVSSAYHAVPRAALGLLHHVMVHLIPAYRQKLNLWPCNIKSFIFVSTELRWQDEGHSWLLNVLGDEDHDDT